MTTVWSTLRWAFTLGGTIAASGLEQQDFDAGEAILNDDRLLASFELDREQ